MADLERFVAELRAAEASLARERMNADAARRVARRLAASRRALRVWWRPYLPAVCFAAGAVLVLVVLAWQQRGKMVADASPRAEQSALQESVIACEDEAVTTTPAIVPTPFVVPPVVVPPVVAAPAEVPSVTPPRVATPRRARAETPVVPAIAEPSAEDRVDALLAELRALRRAGRYADAARRLERALGESWPSRAREVLHYELGTILGNHLEDRERACAHWRAHLQKYPSTRYGRAIADAQQRLACE
jgi:tetratricopeptide (TPR) repeat protein